MYHPELKLPVHFPLTLLKALSRQRACLPLYSQCLVQSLILKEEANLGFWNSHGYLIASPSLPLSHKQTHFYWLSGDASMSREINKKQGSRKERRGGYSRGASRLPNAVIHNWTRLGMGRRCIRTMFSQKTENRGRLPQLDSEHLQKTTAIVIHNGENLEAEVTQKMNWKYSHQNNGEKNCVI